MEQEPNHMADVLKAMAKKVEGLSEAEADRLIDEATDAIMTGQTTPLVDEIMPMIEKLQDKYGDEVLERQIVEVEQSVKQADKTISEIIEKAKNIKGPSADGFKAAKAWYEHVRDASGGKGIEVGRVAEFCQFDVDLYNALDGMFNAVEESARNLAMEYLDLTGVADDKSARDVSLSASPTPSADGASDTHTAGAEASKSQSNDSAPSELPRFVILDGSKIVDSLAGAVIAELSPADVGSEKAMVEGRRLVAALNGDADGLKQLIESGAYGGEIEHFIKYAQSRKAS